MNKFFFGNTIISMIGISIYAARIYNLLTQNRAKVLEKNRQLDYMANYDNLTKLRNRNNIMNQFREYDARKKPYCTIMGDIDDFKRINDTFGHDFGDLVLVSIAEVVRNEMKDRGIAYRWGGEEFLMICPCDKEEGVALIERIRCMVTEKRIVHNNVDIQVTMTFGVCASDEADTGEDMISLADQRLYRGKKNGKNQTICR